MSTKIETQRPGRSDNAKGSSSWRRWASIAKQKGIKYFLISFVDLFGTMRAKIVPATAIDAVAKSGAGFAGFATWFDMTPADPRHPGRCRTRTALIQLPWKPEVAWVTGDLVMDGKAGRAESAPGAQARDRRGRGASGYELKTGVECEYFLIAPDGKADLRRRRPRRPSPATTSRR